MTSLFLRETIVVTLITCKFLQETTVVILITLLVHGSLKVTDFYYSKTATSNTYS